MMTRNHYSKRGSILSLILGPILLISIAVATVNLMTTYEQINRQKQGSIWNIIQLDKEMSRTLADAQKLINGYMDTKTFRISYELLWSRFPETLNSMEKDETFAEIKGVTVQLHEVFSHVKSAEQMILESGGINKSKLGQWINELNEMDKSINQQFLQNITSGNSEYSKKTAKKIFNTAITLSVLIATFILYLGYLLLMLHRERSRNLHMLAHDALTGLHSRDYVMRMIKLLCENKTSFALLTFDLNKFKAVNDTLGHHAGDQLLIHLAKKFQKTLSKFGTVGRVGGDEFLCIIQSDDPHIIQEQYALFLNELKDPCIINNKQILLNISTGGGFAANHDFHVTKLLERVDEAMYQAKARQLEKIFWVKVNTLAASKWNIDDVQMLPAAVNKSRRDSIFFEEESVGSV